MFPAGLIRKQAKLKSFPGIDKYPFNIQQDFKFFFTLQKKLPPRRMVELMKMLKLYRLGVMTAWEILDMVQAGIEKKILGEDFVEW